VEGFERFSACRLSIHSAPSDRKMRGQTGAKVQLAARPQSANALQRDGLKFRMGPELTALEVASQLQTLSHHFLEYDVPSLCVYRPALGSNNRSMSG